MLRSIPNVLTVTPPAGAPAPVLFDSPHSGAVYPADFRYAAPFDLLRSGWDAFVEELFGAAPAHGATLIAAEFPRCYLDANRALEDLDVGLLDGPWPDPVTRSEKTLAGKGLIWRTCKGETPIYDRKLSVAEVRRRIDTCWRPYHAAVKTALDDAHARAGGVWHVNCHSLPSVWGPSVTGAGTAVEVDFILGNRDGATCSTEFTELVRGTLSRLGHTVAVNDRFKGVELIRAYSDPAGNRHGLQIEINRRCYMDETGYERNGGFAPLKASLDRLVAVICDYARSQG